MNYTKEQFKLVKNFIKQHKSTFYSNKQLFLDKSLSLYKNKLKLNQKLRKLAPILKPKLKVRSHLKHKRLNFINMLRTSDSLYNSY